MAAKNMSEQILETAHCLVQTAGYHGFSYADISTQVGIRKASIHYYFPSKADLGKELVVQYRASVRRSTELIAAQTEGADQQLQRYAQVFRDMLRGYPPHLSGGTCLCGVLASEWEGLPEAIRAEVGAFFLENQEWLAEVMERGRTEGTLTFQGPASLQAKAFLASLEGAMLSARVHQDVTLYCAIAHQLLAQLGMDTLDLYSLDFNLSDFPKLSFPIPAQSHR